MSLANSSNWCYANSTIMCLLWTLLCIHPVSLHNWGPRHAELHDFLLRAASGVLALADEMWFCQILHFLGGSVGQQDCAEFSLAVLKWLSSPAFNLRWERRCAIDSEVRIMDHSDSFTPIKLEFSLVLDTRGTCTLTDLVRTWCQVDFMSTALTSASTCLCLQLDRFVQNAEGHIWRSDCRIDLEGAVTFPIFDSSGLQTEFADYQVLAGAGHLGQDLAGHCRAFLQLRPGLDSSSRPLRWMVTDDACSPVPVWHVLEWMHRTVTVLWLLRVDCLQLCPFRPLSAILATTELDPMAEPDALLDLLAAHPGVHNSVHESDI